MKSAEMHGMSDAQLAESLAESEKQLFQVRFQLTSDRTNAASETRKAKKGIARVKTEQRRRELAALAATPADQLPAMLAELHTRAGGPGKRRVQRAIQRLENRRVEVVDTVQAPAKGS